MLGAAQQRGYVRHLLRGAADRGGYPLPQVAYSTGMYRPLAKEATDGAEETFELVVFSSYEVVERAPYLGRREHG